MATIQQIIDLIDTQIYALLADTADITTYRIGDKTVNKTEALAELRKTRESYQKAAENEPYENIEHVALDYGKFGTDESELIGDLSE